MTLHCTLIPNSCTSIWPLKFSCTLYRHTDQTYLISHTSTGITGYIGGDGLFAIASAHPDWELSALVRSQAKATQVTSKYPHIRTVIGDLDSSELIEKEVQDADIVFRMSSFLYPCNESLHS